MFSTRGWRPTRKLSPAHPSGGGDELVPSISHALIPPSKPPPPPSLSLRATACAIRPPSRALLCRTTARACPASRPAAAGPQPESTNIWSVPCAHSRRLAGRPLPEGGGSGEPARLGVRSPGAARARPDDDQRSAQPDVGDWRRAQRRQHRKLGWIAGRIDSGGGGRRQLGRGRRPEEKVCALERRIAHLIPSVRAAPRHHRPLQQQQHPAKVLAYRSHRAGERRSQAAAHRGEPRARCTCRGGRGEHTSAPAAPAVAAARRPPRGVPFRPPPPPPQAGPRAPPPRRRARAAGPQPPPPLLGKRRARAAPWAPPGAAPPPAVRAPAVPATQGHRLPRSALRPVRRARGRAPGPPPRLRADDGGAGSRPSSRMRWF